VICILLLLDHTGMVLMAEELTDVGHKAKLALNGVLGDAAGPACAGRSGAIALLIRFGRF